jgi:hypothetical protein
VLSYISNVELLAIESNYNNDRLSNDKKHSSPDIKARIRSRYGHLSNEMAINLRKLQEQYRSAKPIIPLRLTREFETKNRRITARPLADAGQRDHPHASETTGWTPIIDPIIKRTWLLTHLNPSIEDSR